MSFPYPVIDPDQRRPDQIAGAGTYRQDDPVWVWAPSARQWRPGIVDASSDLAVLVTFLLGQGGGTAVDSLLPRHVMARAEPGADLDGGLADRSLPCRLRITHVSPTGTPAAVWPTASIPTPTTEKEPNLGQKYPK